MSYTYYPAGQVETIASSNAHGVSAAYTYDDQNRLSTVVDNRLTGNNTTAYTYDNASNVATVKYPNGLTSTFTYDTLNRLTELATPPVADYKYTLGLTGNRTGAAEQSGRTLAWNYDGIYRLTGETITGDPANNGGNNGSATYTLDPVGNRTSANSTFSGFTPGFGSYNADDEVSTESYDLNGNTTRTANGNQYTYDSENHMLSMTNGSTLVTMIYDAFGNRVAKTVTNLATRVSSTTQYLVDGLNPTGYPQVMEELSGPIGAGVAARSYTYGLQRISQNLSPAVTGSSAWTPSFYMYDGGGSVRQLTNSLGAVTDEYEYDAFGNSFTRSGTTPNNYLYRGEQFDSDLGLYYLRARYYNPATGRFMSRDPENGIITDPKTLHKYDYAGGDPVNLKDPTGREDDLVDEGLIYRAGIIAILATTTIYGRNDLAQIACDAIAWLNGGVLELTGYEDITFNYANCSAEGKREKCKPGEDNHHMLPQEFIKFFKACDIPDISAPQYMRCVPRDCHTGPGGLHSNQNGKGTNWNGRWATWISGWEEKGICPALPQVLGFMDKLEQEFARQFICAGEEE